jgi:hypothetical protein
MAEEMQTSQWPRMDKSAFSVVRSFEEADRLDREYWLSRTPQERMQALELIRQIAFGYGNGRPFPRLQRVLEVIKPQ